MSKPKRLTVYGMALLSLSLAAANGAGCGRVVKALEVLSGAAQDVQEAQQDREDAAGTTTNPAVKVRQPLLPVGPESTALERTVSTLVDGLVAILSIGLGGGAIYIVRKDRKKQSP